MTPPSGFPAAGISLLRCSRDGEPLALDPAPPSPVDVIDAGTLSCRSCGQRDAIADGIVQGARHPLSARLASTLGLRNRDYERSSR